MLQIKNICKQYKTGSFIQTALNDVSLNLRDNEFVSILGPSGSGKTTLLNIIGGLDKYDSGNIIIDNISTKNYKDKDWDSYRAHTVGFIFQSYNLIPHQTLLKNVEIALTISNVSPKERAKRAKKALEDVGLGEHINKKPNQLSGGQMQRVAIARALVNNPKIILADEPTGALDSKTSIQVMELLKEVAKDRLVVMVTHNPELAKEYSTRIVELKDGVLCSDSNPCEITGSGETKTKNFGKVGMSLFTSMRLSFSNLLSKIKRTTLVAIAGSIGIVGIALIMAISNGANAYIQSMEEQTLSEYPLTIQKSTMDMTSMMTVANSMITLEDDGKVHEQQIISGMFGTVQENDMKSLKDHLDSGVTNIEKYVNAIEYGYGLTPYIYYVNEEGKARQVSPDNVIESVGLSSLASMFTGQTTVFNSLPSDKSLYETKYELLGGKWPQNANELVVILGQGNIISDLAMYNMGLKDAEKLDAMIDSYNKGLTENQLEVGNPEEWEVEEILDREFRLVNAYQMYSYDDKNECWIKISEKDKIQELANQGEILKIVGVARPTAENTNPTLSPAIYYSSDLIYSMIEDAKNSEIVKAQLEGMTINVFTGKAFEDESNEFDLSKLFNFDESSFKNMFNTDMKSFDLDLSKLEDMDIENFDIKDFASEDIFKDIGKIITKDVLEQIFDEVEVDITKEKVNKLFTSLYADFIDSTGNAPNMNVENIGPAIQKYLATDNVKSIINKTIAEQMSNAKNVILSSAEFTSEVINIVSAYTEFIKENEIDAINENNIKLFMETEEAQKIVESIADISEQIVSKMLSANEISEKMVKNLAEDYGVWAESNNEPAMNVIIDAFLAYLKTERAIEIITKQAETMIDKEKLKSNVEKVASDIGDELFDVINSNFSSVIEQFLSEFSTQIESAISKAMTNYVSQMKNVFDFSPESILNIVDMSMSGENLQEMLTNMFSNSKQTAQSNLKSMGYADIDNPDTITFYPKDFETKEQVIQVLEDYNKSMEAMGADEKIISYTDMVGSLMSSVTNIIDIIGYVLIAFVSVSLIVSSIMIGVITYISVLERRKEIGILRAMGASKKNITQVFNCETIITGFLAGFIGVGTTWLILIPTNIILQALTNQPDLKGFLPLSSAIFLIILSIVLTTIGGLLPSKSAAKQDPVVALRSE